MFIKDNIKLYFTGVKKMNEQKQNALRDFIKSLSDNWFDSDNEYYKSDFIEYLEQDFYFNDLIQSNYFLQADLSINNLTNDFLEILKEVENYCSEKNIYFDLHELSIDLIAEYYYRSFIIDCLNYVLDSNEVINTDELTDRLNEYLLESI